MGKSLRFALTCGGVLALAVAVAFWVEAGLTARTSPVSDTIGLYLFLGAVAAAIGASTLWGAISGEIGAMAGGALTLVVFYALLAPSLLLFSEDGSAAVAAGVIGSAAAALVFAAVYVRLHRFPICDTRPLPAPVRVSFAVYSAALAVVGLALLLQVPDVFPMPLSPLGSAIIGSFFVGASSYFASALRRPSWGNAIGQMWAFLTYDAVLIVPLLLQFGHLAPGHLASLILNIAVLIYSGALSVSCLLIWLTPSVRRHRRLHRAHTWSSVSAERGKRAIDPVSSGCS